MNITSKKFSSIFSDYPSSSPSASFEIMHIDIFATTASHLTVFKCTLQDYFPTLLNFLAFGRDRLLTLIAISL